VTITEILQIRFTRWNPPAWVLDDLISFAQEGHRAELQAALLIDTARQDNLFYDFIQQTVVPRWFAGQRELIRADVQRFLDSAQTSHPEVARWSHSTREKLSTNMLTTLRDFGLLQGTASKHIVEPIIPPSVVHHLIRLLQAEGIPPEQVAHHPDWRIWLWDVARAQKAIDSSNVEEHVV
jgi:hypothetical protein